MSAISYQLIIELEQARDIQIGRLGAFHFPAGCYVYTGSAKRNLAQRLARHRRREKRLRWHIDYLLAQPGARIVEVKRSRSEECRLNQQTPGSVAIKGFGASDCRARCGGHLKYLGPRC